jgi:hypothetical protein
LSRTKNKTHDGSDDNKTGKFSERGNPFCGVKLKEGWSLYTGNKKTQLHHRQTELLRKHANPGRKNKK